MTSIAAPDPPAEDIEKSSGPEGASSQTSQLENVLLVGNPNAGKTTLFNMLTGLRAKTSNFPGTTLEVRNGPWTLADEPRRLIDMPGLYSLEAASAEEREALNEITTWTEAGEAESLIVLVLDAMHLERNLYLAGNVLRLNAPVVVALNRYDLFEKSKAELDIVTLESHLGCPVVPVVARSGRGIQDLRDACENAIRTGAKVPTPKLLSQLEEAVSDHTLYRWARTVSESCLSQAPRGVDTITEKVDRVLIHPVGGIVTFMAILFAVFYLIFNLATVPMDLIDGFFADVGGYVGGVLPDGRLNSLIVDGIIGGVGGVLVFLPQICILFFCIAVLEDSGYLARAAAGMDGVFRRVGLPGKAFVPFLSAHACAIPAIMATRIMEDRRDRLVATLVLPLLTCSARLPVYAMVTALLFADQPLLGAAVFTGAYATGIFAALIMSLIFRRTVVRSIPAPLLIELPAYQRPSLRTALLAAYDRGILFVRKAGTLILAISIILWWLMNYPAVNEAAIEEEFAATTAAAPADGAGLPSLDNVIAQQQIESSYAGRAGKFIEPVIEPLGYDWKIGVALVASFAAREVVVSALSVIYGSGEDGVEEESLLLDRLRNAKRADGSPTFGTATAISLLTFFVLAMQCLPTQAVTRRETGEWRWAVLQVTYMTALAYGASFIVYQSLTALGVS